MQDETRTFTRPKNGTGPMHIIRANPPDTTKGYYKYARKGSKWTYCGCACERWEIVIPAETPERICMRCDRAYFSDDNSED